MVKKEFITIIKKGHEKGDILFITGKIVGIAFAVSGYDVGYSVTECDKGYYFVKSFTPEHYKKFKEIINKFHPGLCEFGVL